MFPFGFGCSYTSFEYSDVSVESGEVVKVKCSVRNTGTRDGASVVQVFAGCNESVIERPRRRLVAFKRIEVAAGETVRVLCEFPFLKIATRDTSNHSWFVEGGTWTCEVGQFSGDPRALSALLQVPERIQL
jgi:beta-glucosidase